MPEVHKPAWGAARARGSQVVVEGPRITGQDCTGRVHPTASYGVSLGKDVQPQTELK